MKWTTEAKVGAFTIIGIVYLLRAYFLWGALTIYGLSHEMTILVIFAPSKWAEKWESKFKFSALAIGNVF